MAEGCATADGTTGGLAGHVPGGVLHAAGVASGASLVVVVAPAVLALLTFASSCLAKILLDICRSNHASIHELSYHELISDIQMAKEDLRSKGISVD
ncbi:hypothetical protein VP01_1937g7 [Puccinia sorghi]|uniref:Dolichol-phosphate mannosyltransferase subunit 3 n=1 Tax=Puccinia sorghi TaxID=27349 RepID=A0A0L6VE71_9BASI|nr:hypothetical protein VP01_1937g7 [Puccinia sorghi]